MTTKEGLNRMLRMERERANYAVGRASLLDAHIQGLMAMLGEKENQLAWSRAICAEQAREADELRARILKLEDVIFRKSGE